MTAAVTEQQIAALVERFYGAVRRDPLIGPLFDEAVGDWPAHLDTLARFWSSVMLTSGRYKGNPFAAHMKHGSALKPEFFDRWLAIWAEATEEVVGGEAAALFRHKAARIADSLKFHLFLDHPPGLGIAR
jgi:hemoglobin